MKAKFSLLVAAPAIMLLMAACSSTVHIEKDDNTDFSRYKTFSWVEDEIISRNKSNDLAEQKIKEAVGKELEKTVGWKEVKNRPDVLLSYDVLVENTTKEISSPVYSRPFTRVVYNPVLRRYTTLYYPSQFVGYSRDERPIKEGTITISMIDTRKDKLVWQGWTTDEVNSRNLTGKEIQNSVQAIFKKFDVAKN